MNPVPYVIVASILCGAWLGHTIAPRTFDSPRTYTVTGTVQANQGTELVIHTTNTPLGYINTTREVRLEKKTPLYTLSYLESNGIVEKFEMTPILTPQFIIPGSTVIVFESTQHDSALALLSFARRSL